MCLSIPGRVVSLQANKAVVDYGTERREALTDLLKPKVGDYVLVQAGLVVEVLKAEEAKKLSKACAEAGI